MRDVTIEEPLTDAERQIVLEASRSIEFVPEYKIVGYVCPECRRGKLFHLAWPEKCPLMRRLILTRLDADTTPQVGTKTGTVQTTPNPQERRSQT